MRRLLWLLLAAAGGVLAASLVAGRPGYLLLAFGDWRVEIRSLLLALVLLLLVFLLLHWLLGSAARARQMLLRRRLTRQLKRRERAELDLTAGVLALLDGHYAQAEKLLQRSRRLAATPAIQALALAHLAKLRGDTATRERELAAALAAAPQAQAAVACLRAQAQLDAGDSLAAAATLRAMAEHDSPRLLELQARLYRARRDWPALQGLLPRLRRAGLIDGTQLARQEVEVACARLADSEVPDLLWPQLPRRLRRDADVQLAYAEALRRAGRHDAAQERLAELLRDAWLTAAVEVFGRYAGDDPQRWLAQAEQWLAHHQNDPTLLRSAGRLAQRAGQWAKARAYLESSLLLAPHARVHLELAQLLDGIGQAAAATDHYRAGLRLAVAASAEASAALTGPAPAADDRTHLPPHEA